MKTVPTPILRFLRPTRLHTGLRGARKLCACLCTALCLCVLLGACSTKKNTPVSRQWQAFTTRYNVYFNGIEHYREQLKNMEANYEDDYTRTLLTHPAEARGDEKMPQPQGDFKRTLEKMQKAIQLHSIKKKPPKKSGSAKEKAFRAREEFNPYLHNAWMTMARAQFYDGDFLGSASTFQYISKHFTWLPAVTLEARIWQARAYCALGWLYEAENILVHIKTSELTSGTLRDLYALTMADFMVRSERYAEAVPYLEQAAKSASGSQKNRLWFLLGQIQTQLGNRQAAYQAYKKAGGGITTAYRTKFNARIKQSEVFSGSDIRGEVKALKAMTRYERNNEFLDQIYYAIGNLYMARHDTTEAKHNYALAVEKSTRNGIDKALANLALGNIWYDERDYVKAQPCYAEAVPQLPSNYPDYKALKRRSDVLDELAVYSGNVQLQDSLLRLAAMTPEEQREVCQRIVDELIRKEKEEAEAAAREEFMANRVEGPSLMDQNAAPQPFTINNDKSWYFYNPTAINAGKTEFQRKWGSRKLEDDWRRRNKTSFTFEEPDTDSDEDAEDSEESKEAKEAKERTDDLHNVEYYLAQIPSTPEEIATANDVIQEGLYNMGVILKDKLEDFPAARREFETLDTRYPDNVYRLDAYYNLYLMAVRSDDAAEAETWRRRIIADFPDSPYAQAMADPAYFDHLRQMHTLQESLYAQAYDDYLQDRNSEVHAITRRMESEYPLSPILPKFVFIDALSYLTEGDDTAFRDRLTTLLQKWPDTDMTDMAGSILKGLSAGRKPHAGATNTRGILWEMRLTNDADQSTAADGQPARFERDPNSPQYLVLAFPRDSVSANQLLYDVAKFNFSSFVVQDFDLEPMSFGNVGLLVIKGFANLRQLEHYREVMARGLRLPEGVRPIMISRPNFELLLREGRSFEDYFRFEEDADYAATEAAVLEQSDQSDQSDESDPSDPSDPSDESDPSDPSTQTNNTEP